MFVSWIYASVRTLVSLVNNFLSLLASCPTPVIDLLSRYGTYLYLSVEYPYYVGSVLDT